MTCSTTSATSTVNYNIHNPLHSGKSTTLKNDHEVFIQDYSDFQQYYTNRTKTENSIRIEALKAQLETLIFICQEENEYCENDETTRIYSFLLETRDNIDNTVEKLSKSPCDEISQQFLMTDESSSELQNNLEVNFISLNKEFKNFQAQCPCKTDSENLSFLDELQKRLKPLLEECDSKSIQNSEMKKIFLSLSILQENVLNKINELSPLYTDCNKDEHLVARHSSHETIMLDELNENHTENSTKITSQLGFSEIKEKLKNLNDKFNTLQVKINDKMNLNMYVDNLKLLKTESKILSIESFVNDTLSAHEKDEIFPLLADLQLKINNIRDPLISTCKEDNNETLILKTFDTLFIPLKSTYEYLEFRQDMGKTTIKLLQKLKSDIEAAIQKFHHDFPDHLTKNKLIESLFNPLHEKTTGLITLLEENRTNKEKSLVSNADKWKDIQSRRMDYQKLYVDPQIHTSADINAHLLPLFQFLETNLIPLNANYKELKTRYKFDKNQIEKNEAMHCLTNLMITGRQFVKTFDGGVKFNFIGNSFIPLQKKLLELIFKLDESDIISIEGIADYKRKDYLPEPKKIKCPLHQDLIKSYLALENRYRYLRNIMHYGPHILSGLKFHLTKVEETIQNLLNSLPYDNIKDKETKNGFINQCLLPLKNELKAFIEDAEKKVPKKVPSNPDWFHIVSFPTIS